MNEFVNSSSFILKAFSFPVVGVPQLLHNAPPQKRSRAPTGFSESAGIGVRRTRSTETRTASKPSLREDGANGFRDER